MNYLIDPSRITEFDLNQEELELRLLFWICAAGKTAKTATRCLNNLLINNSFRSKLISPLSILKNIPDLPTELKKYGIGCYNAKAKSFHYLIRNELDLKKCSVEDLEKVPGIGPKTARCFLIHSRRNQNYAGLDTHLLRFLKDLGYTVPKSTPVGKKYKELEAVFLKICEQTKLSASDLDLKIWNAYSSGVPNQILQLVI